MSLWRTLRRWYEQYWFEIVVGLTLVLIAAVVVLFLVLLTRHG